MKKKKIQSSPETEGNSDIHIMVVDDEEYIRDMIQQAIEKAGFTCAAVPSGIKALDVMKQKSVDILITDIKMPQMDGIELMKQVKDKYTTDVIIMTGFIEDYKYESIIQAGASDFIQKPMDIAELILRLKRVIRERAITAEYKRTAEQLKKSFMKLKRVFEQTVRALISVVELRDPYTAGHQHRVSTLACNIAWILHLPYEQIDGLRIASLLHDIGKLAIPSMILNKTGPLRQVEFSLIQRHTEYGRNIVQEIDFPWPIANIIYQHHERVNGTGYPQGKAGEDILIEARIIAVADVVEAMSFQRPYRPELGIDRALKEIKKNRGILFDPDVVDACILLFKEKGFRFETP